MICKSKRGDTKYDFVVALLLGLIVIGIIFYFIFGEYFNSSEMDWQVCRQSILLRNNLPEFDWKGAVFTFKEDYPIKCKTEVVNIDYEDVERAEREFARTLVSCWNLFGNGDYSLFPAANWDSNTFCMYCARVHLEPSVKNYYKANKIDLKRAMVTEFKGGASYYEYLKNVGSEDPFKLVRDWDSDTFVVGVGTKELSFFAIDPKDGIEKDVDFEAVTFGLPQYFDAEKGDLMILFQNFVTRSKTIDSANLFYFQMQDAKYEEDEVGSAYDALTYKSDAFREVRGFIDVLVKDATSPVCSVFDGVPA